ncbi:hypothetical protein AB0C10_37570 [Microbispora amethystogenes]|uniref:hypothetical protein n=1 Tax=Microbispora amethystogenes TaxID=1427754 RepID=UPI0034096893
MTLLEHEIHPYVEVPKAGYPLCICGLWRTHHRHEGISSAVCTCMSCEVGRNPALGSGETEEQTGGQP